MVLDIQQDVPFCFASNEKSTIHEAMCSFVNDMVLILLFVVKQQVGTEHHVKVAENASRRTAQLFIEYIKDRKVGPLF